MEPNHFRPWTWADIAILASFGALAIAMEFIDPRDLDALLGLASPNHGGRGTPPDPPILGMLLFCAWPVLAVGGLGIAVVTFREPGDFRRHGVRGAGTLATFICGFITLVFIVTWYLACKLKPPMWSNPFAGVGGAAADHAGVAVLAAWVTSVLTGGWHAEADWRDRLGRLLGWALITWAWNTFVHTQLVLS